MIVEYSDSGATTFATGLGDPSALAFDAAGNLYEADQLTSYIQKFTPDGVQSTFGYLVKLYRRFGLRQ